MRAVIMAGGKGTRIASLARDIPKPMLPLCGKPVLERQIEVLRREGFLDIVLVVGHLGAVIQNHFKDGAAFGVRITYIEEREPLGTAGALALLGEVLKGDDFLLLNGDVLFDVDLKRFLAFHREKHGIATVFTHPSTHPADSVIVESDKNDRVTAFLAPDTARRASRNRTNAGLHFFSPAVLSRFKTVKKTDLDREVLVPLAAERALFAYNSPEYVKDMGTPQRLQEAERDLAAGVVTHRTPRGAIFLDRDGTINRHVGFVTSPDQIELLPGVAAAIKQLNDRHIPVIVITNQPVLARGEVTEAGLEDIHARLEALLAQESAYLTDIFYCPHHPDSGFAGEVPALKRICDCRKPAPGLLLAAAKRYDLDLSRSFMIGDSESDMTAARRAGCRTAAIGGIQADITGSSLPDCVSKILDVEEYRHDLS
ncbi:MAG: HAD-IIIA family hydrolase [Clostridia bacterium]|nr:HAD-IIIA family hydrolase [Clostridia bacterium]